jgi:hypothetical protein
VRGDAAALVAEQVLAIFEGHAGGAKAAAEGVLQIVDSHSAKAISRLDPGLICPAISGPGGCSLEWNVGDLDNAETEIHD